MMRSPSLSPLHCCALTLLLLSTTQAKADPLDALAAVVNNEAVTCSDVSSDLDQIMAQLGDQASRLDRKEMFNRALDGRITQILQVQRGERLDLKVENEEIEKAMADVEERNGLQSGQLPEALKEQGIDPEEYKENLRRQLMASKVVNIDLRSKLQISEEAMREYHRKYLATSGPVREARLAELMLALPSDPTPEQVAVVRNKINKLRDDITSKQISFSEAAAFNSDSPSAKEGGDIGWWLPGSLPPRFALALDLKVGEVSPVVRSPSGFHLLYVTDERNQDQNERADSYDEARARHILIKVPTDDETKAAAVRAHAVQIATELSRASDDEFAKRAKELSQDPGSAENGGDLGWFRHGQMVDTFEKVAFSLQPGQTSDLVTSPFGLHIIRVTGRRHLDPNSFEAHRDQIHDILLNAEMQNQMPRWLASLRDKANITRHDCPTY